jgi:hypothetical protein
MVCPKCLILLYPGMRITCLYARLGIGVAFSFDLSNFFDYSVSKMTT